MNRHLIIGLIALTACQSQHKAGPGTAKKGDTREAEWVSLFEGKSLGNWKPAAFGGEGEVRVEDGAIVMQMGSPMTGVTWQGEPPARMNYEIEWDAQRTLGNDFFCALTFPVNNAPCSLVAAGWGGAVVGLSSLDGMDASQNDTTTFFRFENDHWYHFRLRVTPGHLEAWIDKQRVVDTHTDGRRISIRPEVQRSVPLGFATYTSEGWVKNIRWRLVGVETTGSGEKR